MSRKTSPKFLLSPQTPFNQFQIQSVTAVTATITITKCSSNYGRKKLLFLPTAESLLQFYYVLKRKPRHTHEPCPALKSVPSFCREAYLSSTKELLSIGNNAPISLWQRSILSIDGRTSNDENRFSKDRLSSKPDRLFSYTFRVSGFSRLCGLYSPVEQFLYTYSA